MLNALMKLGSAKGETKMGGKSSVYTKDAWIELQGWDWEVEAESSWTKGGGASVGKPNPGKMNWEHYFDTSSCMVLKYICTGQAFEQVELHMLKGTGGGNTHGMNQEAYFKMVMKGAFITKVVNSATEEGNVVQKVEMVFKEVNITYHQQLDGTDTGTSSSLPGKLGPAFTFGWDIPAGVVK